jgi:hypothetical protein
VELWRYPRTRRRFTMYRIWTAKVTRNSTINVDRVIYSDRMSLDAEPYEAKFMLPWSFSEEFAAEKYMAQLQHNMWVTNARMAALSIITGGGKWVEISIAADPLYQHLLLTAEKKFWRCVSFGEPPRLFGVEPPRPRIEAVQPSQYDRSQVDRLFGCSWNRRADPPMGRNIVKAALLPQLSGNNQRIKLDGSPPCRLVAPGMEDTMVDAAKGNRELVADPAAQGARLGKSQVMGVRRPASAQDARLRGYELQMRSIAVAARFAQRESTFIDMPGNGVVHVLCRPGAYDRQSDFVLRGHRHGSGRMSAAPLLAGNLSCRVGRFALVWCGRGRELEIRCNRFIGGGRLRRSRNCRAVIAEARRCGQGLFIESAVRKSGQPRCERSLYETGVQRREGVLGGEGALRPRRGLIRRGKVPQLAQQLIAQSG